MDNTGPSLFKVEPTEWTDADRENHPGRKVVSLYNSTATAIPDGSWVSHDVADTDRLGSAIKISPATANHPNVVGCADEEIPAGKWGKVVVYGYKADANVVNGVAAEVTLASSGATAGRALAAAAPPIKVIGYTLTASGASNTADVFVTCD